MLVTMRWDAGFVVDSRNSVAMVKSFLFLPRRNFQSVRGGGHLTMLNNDGAAVLSDMGECVQRFEVSTSSLPLRPPLFRDRLFDVLGGNPRLRCSQTSSGI